MQRRSTAFEATVQLEDEIVRLQRKHRNLDTNRRKHQQINRLSARKSKKPGVISTLLREEHNLIIDLNVAASDHNRRIDDQIIKEIRDLLHEHEDFKEKIVIKKQHDQDVEGQIKEIQKKIVESNVMNKASDARHQERIQLMQKNIVKLENRLEMQVIRFSCIHKDNIILREEIQLLMKERERFNKDWERFFYTLKLNKRFMNDLILQIMVVYDKREEFCKKLHVLSHKARMDNMLHTENMVEMHRIMDSQANLSDFLEHKSQRRIAIAAINKVKLRQQHNEIQVERKRDILAKTLADIKEYADCSDIDHIQREFLHTEEETFSVLTHLNNIHIESEHIAETIGYLRNKWEQKQFLKKSRAKYQKKRLDNLMTYLKDAQDETRNYSDQLKAQNATIATLFRGILNLIATMKWDPNKLKHLLGQYDRRKTMHVDQLRSIAPVKTRIAKTDTIIDVHNVGCFLGELETSVINAMKNALIYQKTVSPAKKIIKMTAAKSNVIKIEDLETPCPLCMEESNLISCPSAPTSALTRSTIMNMLVEESLEYRMLQANMHTLSKCNLHGPGHTTFVQDDFIT